MWRSANGGFTVSLCPVAIGELYSRADFRLMCVEEKQLDNDIYSTQLQA